MYWDLTLHLNTASVPARFALISSFFLKMWIHLWVTRRNRTEYTLFIVFVNGLFTLLAYLCMSIVIQCTLVIFVELTFSGCQITNDYMFNQMGSEVPNSPSLYQQNAVK